LTVVSLMDIISELILKLSVEDMKKFDFNWLDQSNEFKNLTASTIRTTKFESVNIVNGKQSALEAMSMMKQNKVHRVVVLDDNLKPLSILTQSRMIRLAATMMENIPNAKKTISELGLDKKSQIQAVDENFPALEAFKQMIENKVCAVAVVTSSGEIVGTISETDIRQVGFNLKFFFYLSLTCKGYLEHVRIYDSTRTVPSNVDPICVKPTSTIEDVIKTLNYYSIHRVFVIDQNRKPIGVVSASDVMSVII